MANSTWGAYSVGLNPKTGKPNAPVSGGKKGK